MGQGPQVERGGLREWVAKGWRAAHIAEDPRGPWLETMRQERDEASPEREAGQVRWRPVTKHSKASPLKAGQALKGFMKGMTWCHHSSGETILDAAWRKRSGGSKADRKSGWEVLMEPQWRGLGSCQ